MFSTECLPIFSILPKLSFSSIGITRSATLWTQLSYYSSTKQCQSHTCWLCSEPWSHSWYKSFLCSTHFLTSSTVRNQFTNEGRKFSKVSSFREAKPRLIPTRSFAPRPHLGLLGPQTPLNRFALSRLPLMLFHLTMLITIHWPEMKIVIIESWTECQILHSSVRRSFILCLTRHNTTTDGPTDGSRYRANAA